MDVPSLDTMPKTVFDGGTGLVPVLTTESLHCTAAIGLCSGKEPESILQTLSWMACVVAMLLQSIGEAAKSIWFVQLILCIFPPQRVDDQISVSVQRLQTVSLVCAKLQLSSFPEDHLFDFCHFPCLSMEQDKFRVDDASAKIAMHGVIQGHVDGQLPSCGAAAPDSVCVQPET